MTKDREVDMPLSNITQLVQLTRNFHNKSASLFRNKLHFAAIYSSGIWGQYSTVVENNGHQVYTVNSRKIEGIGELPFQTNDSPSCGTSALCLIVNNMYAFNFS
ncbi:hypothetical protein HMI54_002738 [Coelomomyces lativittatus]|nr:hypothetical protein HMI54_002738 [Coelomomyces lativittatus]